MIESINVFSADWSAWLWRITWQSAVVFSVALVLTILARRTSPRLRSWIWRIAYVKVLILMIWTTPIRLPVLPPESTATIAVRAEPQTDIDQPATPVRAAPQNDIAAMPLSHDVKAAGREHTQSAELPPIATTNTRVAEISQSAHPLAWQSYLFFAWLAGMVMVGFRLAREIGSVVKLARSVRTLESPELLGVQAELCTQMRTPGSARIGESHLASGPMLVKFWTPTIVFPTGMIQQLEPQELRLALAHELAHLKRHDLAWNALAAVVNVALYFHPMAWFAHRANRQQQEMACDELVVTSLGVERHAYGEMLLKVVRRLGRTFPTGMAVVGMASSYQTLSQRIEAMSRFSPLTRRQTTLAACGLALLGLLTILPWQVVAQQPIATTNEKPQQSPVSLGESTQADIHSPKTPLVEAADESTIKDLLIGTWRDSVGKQVVFQADGTYQDFGVNIFVGMATGRDSNGKEYRTASRTRGGGNWQFGNGFLTLTYEPSSKLWTGKADGLKSNPSQGSSRCDFIVVRLDQKLLRLKFTSDYGNETYFLSRNDEEPLDQRFAAVSAELRPLFDAAQLTSDEASTVVDLLDARKNDLSDLHIAARIQQARIQKITLQKLFGMTPDEVDAFRELLKQHEHSQQTFKELADGGQLLPIEKDAYEKTDIITQAFDNLAANIPLLTVTSRSLEGEEFVRLLG